MDHALFSKTSFRLNQYTISLRKAYSINIIIHVTTARGAERIQLPVVIVVSVGDFVKQRGRYLRTSVNN